MSVFVSDAPPNSESELEVKSLSMWQSTSATEHLAVSLIAKVGVLCLQYVRTSLIPSLVAASEDVGSSIFVSRVKDDHASVIALAPGWQVADYWESDGGNTNKIPGLSLVRSLHVQCAAVDCLRTRKGRIYFVNTCFRRMPFDRFSGRDFIHSVSHLAGQGNMLPVLKFGLIMGDFGPRYVKLPHCKTMSKQLDNNFWSRVVRCGATRAVSVAPQSPCLCTRVPNTLPRPLEARVPGSLLVFTWNVRHPMTHRECNYMSPEERKRHAEKYNRRIVQQVDEVVSFWMGRSGTSGICLLFQEADGAFQDLLSKTLRRKNITSCSAGLVSRNLLIVALQVGDNLRFENLEIGYPVAPMQILVCPALSTCVVNVHSFVPQEDNPELLVDDMLYRVFRELRRREVLPESAGWTLVVAGDFNRWVHSPPEDTPPWNPYPWTNAIQRQMRADTFFHERTFDTEHTHDLDHIFVWSQHRVTGISRQIMSSCWPAHRDWSVEKMLSDHVPVAASIDVDG